MYKYYIISIFFLLISIYIKSQTFSNIISNPNDQIINEIKEDQNGNFILVGRYENLTGNKFDAYIIKLDSEGNILFEETISNDSISFILFNIHFVNDEYILLGETFDKTPAFANCHFWYLRLNQDLTVIDEKFNLIPKGKWISYMNSIIDSDSNLAITGYTSFFDTLSNVYNSDLYFYKTNIDGDSINSNFFNTSNIIDMSFDIVEKSDDDGYDAYVSGFTNMFGSHGQILELNNNLDSIGIDSIPLRIYDYYSPTELNDTTIILCGKRLSSIYGRDLNIATINPDANFINFAHLGKVDTVDWPAFSNGISKFENNLFVAGTSNLEVSNPFFSTLPSWFYLIKLNSSLDIEWQKWYGGDTYYNLYSIYATQDGGCVMAGTRYDYLSQYYERDIYIVKVDSEGLITWTQEIPIKQESVLIYPNPGHNKLKIKSSTDDLIFELFNSNGMNLITKELIQFETVINTSFLKPGIFVYNLKNKEGQIVETGKWIKK